MTAGPSAGMSAAKRWSHCLFAVLLATSLLVWWHSLASTLILALERDAYTHILLIAPLSVALICLERNTVQLPFEGSAGAGTFLLTIGLFMRVVAEWGAAIPSDVRLSLNMLALVVWWIGSVIFCYGTRAFRWFLFPLCFLLLIVPIPDAVLNWIIEWLQQQSATTARLMFRVARVPVTQDGIMLFIPGLDIEVARECSSIRSSLILVITTIVLVHLLLRSWWRKSLLVAAAIPLSFVKNGFRIFVISELGTRVDPSFFDGQLHRHGGIVFLTIALGAVVALLWVLRRTEGPHPRKLVLSTARE
jgi:exosortase